MGDNQTTEATPTHVDHAKVTFPDGVPITLPAEVTDLLKALTSALSQGLSITVTVNGPIVVTHPPATRWRLMPGVPAHNDPKET